MARTSVLWISNGTAETAPTPRSPNPIEGHVKNPTTPARPTRPDTWSSSGQLNFDPNAAGAGW